MNSEEPSRLRSQPFDPGDIPPYSVIRVRQGFSNEGRSESRLFVCLGHRDGVAACLKVTSKTSYYAKRPDRMAGIVFYPAGSVGCFRLDTIVDPDIQLPILHTTIISQRLSGEFCVEGALPEDFEEKFARAVKDSVILSPRHQKRLLAMVGRSLG